MPSHSIQVAKPSFGKLQFLFDPTSLSSGALNRFQLIHTSLFRANSKSQRKSNRLVCKLAHKH